MITRLRGGGRREKREVAAVSSVDEGRSVGGGMKEEEVPTERTPIFPLFHDGAVQSIIAAALVIGITHHDIFSSC